MVITLGILIFIIGFIYLICKMGRKEDKGDSSRFDDGNIWCE